MEAWRRVEVAGLPRRCDGPDARRTSRRSAPRPSPSRPSRSARRSPTTTSPRSSTCSARVGRARRALDPLRPDLLRRARHRAGAAARARPARSLVAGARELVDALAAQAREHVDTRLRRAHPRRPRRADDVRHQARRLRVRGRTATSSASSAPFAQASVGAISGAVGTYAADVPGLRARASWPPRAWSAEPVSTQVVPRDRHAELLQAIALAGAGPGALRDRDPPPAAHRGPRGRGAVPRRRAEGLERDAAQAQPDHHRAHHRPGARAARLRPGRRRERRALARARHLALRRRARRPARRDDRCLDYMQHLAPAPGRAAWSSTPTACARTSTSPTARCSPSACCWRWSAGGMHARRGLPHRPAAPPSRRGTTGTPLRELLAADAATSSLDLDDVFDLRHFTRHAREIVGAPRRHRLRSRLDLTRPGGRRVAPCPPTTTSSSAPARPGACWPRA